MSNAESNDAAEALVGIVNNWIKSEVPFEVPYALAEHVRIRAKRFMRGRRNVMLCYAKEVSEMDNRILLSEYASGACGDDYDGAFTEKGAWQYLAIKFECERRLAMHGWLNFLNDEPEQIKK